MAIKEVVRKFFQPWAVLVAILIGLFTLPTLLFQQPTTEEIRQAHELSDFLEFCESADREGRETDFKDARVILGSDVYRCAIFRVAGNMPVSREIEKGVFRLNRRVYIEDTIDVVRAGEPDSCMRTAHANSYHNPPYEKRDIQWKRVVPEESFCGDYVPWRLRIGRFTATQESRVPTIRWEVEI